MKTKLEVPTGIKIILKSTSVDGLLNISLGLIAPQTELRFTNKAIKIITTICNLEYGNKTSSKKYVTLRALV